MKSSVGKAVFAVLTLVLLLTGSAWSDGKGKAQDSTEAGSGGKATVTVLYNFGSTDPDLIYPAGPAVSQGRDGSLYSTTSYGGTFNDGVVFKITTKGTPTVLDQLSSYNGSSGLTLGTDGNFYGATVYGGIGPGYGTAFKITPHGKLTTLYDFSGQNFDAYPHAPPIEAADGNFYGATLGGFTGNGGEVYKMTSSGDETSLFKFDRKDGANPGDPLIQAKDGNFYGTTNVGGTSGACEQYGCGTIFRLTPSGVLTVLHSFKASDGFYPVAPLIQGSDNNFYGTVPQGGANYDHGVIFKITPSGKFTVLHIFKGTPDGEAPNAALLQATDGNFYGTTEGGGASSLGTIYRITRRGEYSVIYSFDGATGAYPSTALLQHTDGKLCGFAGEGGTHNFGTFYSLDLGLSPFVSLVSTSGRIGRSIGVLGQGFTSASEVAFNGRSAKFKIISNTYLAATVPAGATTGFVTVTTHGGKLTSNKKFQVVQ